MALASPFHRVAHTALSVIAVLSSMGSAAHVPDNSTAGECEEVGLLQWAAPKTAESKCKIPCVNGHCVWWANYCKCYTGWSGMDCSVPAEFLDAPGPHDDHGGMGRCDLHDAEIFPYSQEKLWGTAYSGLGWQDCAKKSQSPINIVCMMAKPTSGPKLNQNFGTSSESPDHVENNGHSLQVNGDFGSLKIGGATYETLQFHFHHPSEHTIDFKHATLEMHIVTKDPTTNSTAVVGILFDIGKPNKCLERVFQDPAPQAVCENPVGKVDLSCFEEQLSGNYWTYTGSLTTPPCTEGIKWNVMKIRSTISVEQLKVFKTRYLNNARPVKPLNGRTVTYHKVK